MGTPLISTITPCYNMKPYLKRFLDELPQQTIFNQIEIVLDHNEPDDEEVGWVREFQAKYPGIIKHIITNPVEFIGPSMNRCIREASAPLLAIWNVDDLRTPNSLEIQVDAFNKGADFVYGNFQYVRKFGSKTGSWFDFSKYQTQPEEFKRSMLLGPFMAFRKSLTEKAGMFDEQLKSGADFDLAIRLAYHGKPGMVNGSLGYYLNEGKGASTRPNSKQPLERTVIELRYGTYEKMDYDYVVNALSYDIEHIYVNGVKTPVLDYIPNYHNIIKEAKENLIEIGLKKYAFKKFIRYNKIRNEVKSVVKRLLYGIK
jgi:glycosyltransferase involved in cell wall biosynthesis